MKNTRLIVIVFLCSALSLFADKELVPAKATHEDLVRLEREVTKEASRYLQTWYPRAMDHEHGGYWQGFDYKWNRKGDASKNLVNQARHLWMSSTAAMAYPEQKAFRESAEHGFAFLSNQMVDKVNGGWYWTLDAELSPNGSVGAHKVAYGLSFGIYACAAYYKLTGDERAKALAIEVFQRLDRASHDAINGGYYVFMTPDWQIIYQDDEESKWCPVSVYPGNKDMNTHIHLLESFTALYGIWPDRKLRLRTEELLEIMQHKIGVPMGALNQYFTADWKVLPTADSFGHDVETAFLILETMEVLGLEDAGKDAFARKLVNHAIRKGTDSEGGLIDLGDAYGGKYRMEKAFWVQAEFLHALAMMSYRHGHEEPLFTDHLVHQWDYINTYMIDHKYGGWYSVGGHHEQTPKADKGTAWKASYHIGRALLGTQHHLERILESSANPLTQQGPES